MLIFIAAIIRIVKTRINTYIATIRIAKTRIAKMRISKYIIPCVCLCAVNIQSLNAQKPPDSLSQSIDPQSQSADSLWLGADSLSQVVISSKKKMIQIEKGKIILNLQNSALTSGSSALDMIRRLPGVSIGQEDEITLRGSTGINVLIDGKMTYLSGKQLSSLLKGMSAENLVKLELTASPGSEYDAQGNAGVINIITKSRNNKAYAIDIRSSITKGKYWMVNENISGSINIKKLNVYGSIDYNTPHSSLSGNSSSTITEDGEINNLRRQRTNDYKIKFYTYKLGADWQPAPGHELSVNYHGYFDDFTSSGTSNQFKYYGNGGLNKITRSVNTLIEPYHYDAANASYRILLDSSGRQLTTEGHYISYRNFSDGLLTSADYDGNDVPTGASHALRSHQPGFVKIKSIKSDLVLPFKTISMRAGLKYAIVTNDNNYRFDSLVNNNYVKAESLSDYFIYTERIGAVYATASKKINQTTIEAGLRAEHTDADGHTLKNAFNNKWRYTRLFPSLSIDHPIGERNKLSLALSRRIDRPAYANLNPVRWYVDQYFYFSGNPNLVPEMAWVLSGTYTLDQKYAFTAAYRKSNNFLSRQLQTDSTGAIRSQTANFKEMNRLDLMLALPWSVARFWDLQISANVSYISYPVSQKSGFKLLSQWAGNVQLNQQLKLPAGINMEINAGYFTDDVNGIYKTADYCFLDAGFRRSFVEGKLDVHVSVTDVFWTTRFVGVSQSDLSDYRYHDIKDSRRAGISLRYHIGGKLLSRKGSRIEEQERL